ncbi:MAG: DUF2180 family protein [Thioalkalivibrio sp.]|nr:DUF2180 family protein [Thioalkalivibrio sp.]
MICYVCDSKGGAGGTRAGIREAAGVCHACGVGVCREHAQRDATSGVLLCPLHALATSAVPLQPRMTGVAFARPAAGA